MILALLWLIISAPFVYSSQQNHSKLNEMANVSVPNADTKEEATNPFDNNDEEKVPSDENSFSEEFLPDDNYKTDYLAYIRLHSPKCENTSTYLAFDGEILVPPPCYN